jgi:prevent-host-death family protein
MKLSQLVEEVSPLDEEITITRDGKPVAISVSPAEFDSWKATLTIRADAELMVEIRRGLEDIKKYASFIPLKSHSLSK